MSFQKYVYIQCFFNNCLKCYGTQSFQLFFLPRRFTNCKYSGIIECKKSENVLHNVNQQQTLPKPICYVKTVGYVFIGSGSWSKPHFRRINVTRSVRKIGNQSKKNHIENKISYNLLRESKVNVKLYMMAVNMFIAS